MFLHNTPSFPPRNAALDEYAKAVEDLDRFLKAFGYDHRRIPDADLQTEGDTGVGSSGDGELRNKRRCAFTRSRYKRRVQRVGGCARESTHGSFL